MDTLLQRLDRLNLPESFIPLEGNEIDDRRFAHSFRYYLNDEEDEDKRILKEWCEQNQYRPKYRCGHDYDCCGCLFRTDLDYSYAKGVVTIILTEHYNY